MSAESAAGRTDTPPPCPVCGSDDVGPVVYGFPGGEMWEAAEAGTVRLGGCVVEDRDRWWDRWFCRRCDAR